MVLQKYEIKIQKDIQLLSMSTADFSNIYHNWILRLGTADAVLFSYQRTVHSCFAELLLNFWQEFIKKKKLFFI